MAFIYRGLKLEKYADIIDFALNLKGKDQDDFVEEYAKSGPHALSNIGYVSGYYGAEKMALIQEVFKTAHPIFGRRRPSVEEAFEKGKQLGNEVKRKAGR